ncbi:GtrA family protein [Corynebacterium sp. HS2168-gen11]|uniref:GtrA family protein n=1 Tax=Corynebacterium sp. HS2168-gen11 TaxID=2974027 RepID=UPI00216B5CC8|nr:GtrA family protein [Corynebacterium sp. HS2168-gen11]MCS4535544.1 GtrA family protein [Corynebacterium sp. HS2168-gen11]
MTNLRTQLTRFIAVGIVAAIVDLGSTLLFDYGLGVDRTLAKVFGWVLGTITAYVLNSKWTFNSKVSARSSLAVAVLYVSTLAVQTYLYRVLEAPLSSIFNEFMTDLGAFVIAQGVATVTNFIMQRAFIFKDDKSAPADPSDAA